MNTFIEKKSNFGFYNLRDPLRFKVVFTCNDFEAASLLLRGFKLPFRLRRFFTS
jgi:hypothetical protein